MNTFALAVIVFVTVLALLPPRLDPIMRFARWLARCRWQ